MLPWDFLPTGEGRLCLEKAFIEEKRPRQLAKHQPQAPRWGCEEKRVRRGRVGMFVRSAGFKGCFAARSPANISPPATRQWVGDAWSKLPPVGSPAVPKAPGGRERGAGQSCRLCSAAFPKPLRSRSLAGREGASPGGGDEGKSRHKCTAASPPLPSRPHGARCVPPPRQPPWLSVAPGGYLSIYL